MIKMTSQQRIPSKMKPASFISCFNRANDRAKFGYWVGNLRRKSKMRNLK